MKQQSPPSLPVLIAIAAAALLLVSACANETSEPSTALNIAAAGGGLTCYFSPSCPDANGEWGDFGYMCNAHQQTDWILMVCENNVLEIDVTNFAERGYASDVIRWRGRISFERESAGASSGSFDVQNTSFEIPIRTSESGPGYVKTWFSTNGTATPWADIGKALWTATERDSGYAQDVFRFSELKLTSPLSHQTIVVEGLVAQFCRGCRGERPIVTMQYGAPQTSE